MAGEQHRIAERVRRGVVVADGAQDKAGAASVEKPPDRDDQQDRHINEAILPKQDAANERQIGQARDIELRCRADALADKARADQAGETDAEDGQCKPGRDLIDRQAERQRGEQQR